MKSTLYLVGALCALCLFTAPAAAQECDATPSTTVLEGNVVRSVYSTGGDIWFDGSDAGYTVTPPGTINPYAVFFAGGLWMAAKDPGSEIKVSAQTYGRAAGRFDYQPGPLTADGLEFSDSCEDWAAAFTITAEAVSNYQNLFQGANLRPEDIDEKILGWPAVGNPYFFDVQGFELPNTPQGLAPYWDEDLDGVYDPTRGDYPLFCGDQAQWSVFNDKKVSLSSLTSQPLSMEVHLLAYSYNSSDPALNATTFHEYTFVNRGQEDAIDFYAAQWLDYDLGCSTNDRFNAIPDRDLFYIYNDSPVEDACAGGTASTGNTSPVAIVQLVEGLRAPNADLTGEIELGMTGLVSYYNDGVGSPTPATTEPRTAEEYFNIMTGRWRDGTPLTRGGTGYQSGGATTRFANDGGDDADGNAWLGCNGAGGADFVDGRIVMSSGPVTLRPGAVNTMTFAVTTVFDVAYNGECPDEDAVIAAAASVEGVFDESCSRGGISTGTAPQPGREVGLSVYPNPTNGVITFELPAGERISNVQLFSVTGQRVVEIAGTSDRVQYNTARDNLSPGVYFYLVSTASGKVASGRISIVD